MNRGNGGGGCVTYHVASKATWVADTSAQSPCSLSSARSYNLEIASPADMIKSNGRKYYPGLALLDTE